MAPIRPCGFGVVSSKAPPSEESPAARIGPRPLSPPGAYPGLLDGGPPLKPSLSRRLFGTVDSTSTPQCPTNPSAFPIGQNTKSLPNYDGQFLSCGAPNLACSPGAPHPQLGSRRNRSRGSLFDALAHAKITPTSPRSVTLPKRVHTFVVLHRLG
jgi:hypothetical protein